MISARNRVFPATIVTVIDDGDDDDLSIVYVSRGRTRNNRGTNKTNAISVEQYTAGATFVDLSSDGDDDGVQVLHSFSNSKIRTRKRRAFEGGGISITEPGESSNSNNPQISSTFMCEICFDPKPCTESFSIMGCTHAYCSECMIRYVASKLQENITQIRCPNSECKTGLLEPEHCRSILPQEVFDRWGNALCESVILASEKFYCPFNDCSAMLIDDRSSSNEKGEVITQSECPNCWRLFCVQCKVPWHFEIKCEEFQKLNKDEMEREDIMLMQLAKKKEWNRCPKCRFFVEKSEGCLYIRCRCGFSFCYKCAAPMKEHYCRSCKR